MRILSLDKHYVHEVYQGNNPGEYEINFPQLSTTLNWTKEEWFYKKQITRDNQKLVFSELEEKIKDEAERKEYIASEEGQKHLKARMEELSYTLHYTILVWGEVLDISHLLENYDITDNNNIITQNIEIE